MAKTPKKKPPAKKLPPKTPRKRALPKKRKAPRPAPKRPAKGKRQSPKKPKPGLVKSQPKRAKKKPAPPRKAVRPKTPSKKPKPAPRKKPQVQAKKTKPQRKPVRPKPPTKKVQPKWMAPKRTKKVPPRLPAPEKILPETAEKSLLPEEIPTKDLGMPTELTAYMREVGKHTLLTRAEEKKLAILGLKPGKKGKRARTELVEKNLRFVISIARGYQGLGLDLPDLISEGNIGLHLAVEKFNPHNGAKLTTYAAWWIKQRIRRALSNQGKTIRVPVHMNDKMSKILRISTRMAHELGRDPTPTEIAEETGLPPKKVESILNLQFRTVSLDAPLGDEDSSTTLGETIRDDKAERPEHAAELTQEKELLKKLFTTLPKREQAILSQRFGLDGDESQTLESVGRKFKVTRERIRQLQNIALRKLRKKMDRLKKGYSIHQ